MESACAALALHACRYRLRQLVSSRSFTRTVKAHHGSLVSKGCDAQAGKCPACPPEVLLLEVVSLLNEGELTVSTDRLPPHCDKGFSLFFRFLSCFCRKFVP